MAPERSAPSSTAPLKSDREKFTPRRSHPAKYRYSSSACIHSVNGTSGHGAPGPTSSSGPPTPMSPLEKVTGGVPSQVRVKVPSRLSATTQPAPSVPSSPSWPSRRISGALPGHCRMYWPADGVTVQVAPSVPSSPSVTTTGVWPGQVRTNEVVSMTLTVQARPSDQVTGALPGQVIV
jgi:hypothetical protein